ncbi:hypothetical protein PIB30_034328 [Stylosanthes scabra]|uniref:Uncharacterized protein n=1 Tax=Stylosanthes scabra TaxID=79078 RepID=A0ABU6TCZ9_9FABA|nr:hypothetical protein [Stylosanthes scabra]
MGFSNHSPFASVATSGSLLPTWAIPLATGWKHLNGVFFNWVNSAELDQTRSNSRVQAQVSEFKKDPCSRLTHTLPISLSLVSSEALAPSAQLCIVVGHRLHSLLIRTSSSFAAPPTLGHSSFRRRLSAPLLPSCTRAPRLRGVSSSPTRTPLSPTPSDRAPPFLALVILISSLSRASRPHCLCLCILHSCPLQLGGSATPSTPPQLQDWNSIYFSSTPPRLQPCLLNSAVPPFLVNTGNR